VDCLSLFFAVLFSLCVSGWASASANTLYSLLFGGAVYSLRFQRTLQYQFQLKFKALVLVPLYLQQHEYHSFEHCELSVR
jgi:hypothetical protein